MNVMKEFLVNGFRVYCFEPIFYDHECTFDFINSTFDVEIEMKMRVKFDGKLIGRMVLTAVLSMILPLCMQAQTTRWELTKYLGQPFYSDVQYSIAKDTKPNRFKYSYGVSALVIIGLPKVKLRYNLSPQLGFSLDARFTQYDPDNLRWFDETSKFPRVSWREELVTAMQVETSFNLSESRWKLCSSIGYIHRWIALTQQLHSPFQDLFYWDDITKNDPGLVMEAALKYHFKKWPKLWYGVGGQQTYFVSGLNVTIIGLNISKGFGKNIGKI